MKERLIITEKSLIESTKHIAKEYDKEDVAEHTIEQVPETWEELKELCRDLESKDVFITSTGDCIEYHGLYFWKDGSISKDADQSIFAIKIDVTPARQWQIIKNLIGE